MVRKMSADTATRPAPVDDLLFAGQILEAMTAFRAWSGCGLQSAIDGIGERMVDTASAPTRPIVREAIRCHFAVNTCALSLHDRANRIDHRSRRPPGLWR
jgi:hypothetical protein